MSFKLEDLGADTSIALVANGDADHDPARMKPAVTAFFDFIKTPEGQEILAGF